METVISENKNYRIIKVTREGEGENKTVLSNDFYVGSTRCRFQLGEAMAKLEKKTYFLFGSYWQRIEITNIANVVQEWMDTHFNGEKLWNGK